MNIMSQNTQKYYIVLSGAKKNVGDFLITERAIKLLQYHAPEYQYIKYPHWQQFEDLDFVNKSEGIIILGGPGYQIDMFPGVYKLTDNIEDITCSIYVLGSGWKGIPGDLTTEKLYTFNDKSFKLLNKIENNPAGMSTRDYQTVRVLTNNGYKNVAMTGCPVWYDIPSLGKSFEVPSEFKNIIYTPAQSEMFYKQSIDVMDYLKSKYPNANVIVAFHRGIGIVDEFTSESDAINTQKLADYAASIGFETRDVSFETSKIDFYEDCDFHVGYRVHAHIFFMSKRLPSILLHEDGRGNGVSEALKSPGINAYKTSQLGSKLFGLFRKNIFIYKAYKRLTLKINDELVLTLDKRIDELIKNNFEDYKVSAEIIDTRFNEMSKYIKKIVQ